MTIIPITFPESTLKYFNLQCNSVCLDYTTCPEILLIKDFLSSISPPKNCLDIGAGLGRISVYINKYFNWKSKYWLMDGDSGTEQIAGMNYEPKRAFYNSMLATKDFCIANDLTNFELINIEAQCSLPPQNTFDLCYSCKAIGFHWPIKDYLDIVGPLAKSGSYWFFELRSKDKTYYKEEKRWERACRFTDWQLQNLEAYAKYEIVKTKSNTSTFIVIFKKRG